MRSLALLLLLLAACAPRAEKSVVVYCSLDQVYSEPVLQDFERSTGIRVLARYDLEATKTSGLVNLLLAERAAPRCDVLWNNEMLQTEVLRQEGLLEPYISPGAATIPPAWKDPDGAWTGFAARKRVILYNTDRVTKDPPQDLDDLLDPRWKGQAGLARPLFGTTLTHFVCLAQTRDLPPFLDGLQANEVQILDGNSVVKDRVARGDLAWGWTDTDDAHLAILAGSPVKVVVPEDTLLIPNTVALIAGGPHPQEARQLVDYLLSDQVEQRLARSESQQIPLHGARPEPGPDLRKAAIDFPEVLDLLRARFVR